MGSALLYRLATISGKRGGFWAEVAFSGQRGAVFVGVTIGSVRLHASPYGERYDVP
jgi:hypothetical protein